MGLKDSLGSRGPFSSSIFFFIEFRLDIQLLCFFLEYLIFLFSLPNFFFLHLICFWFEVGGGSCSIGGSMKVSLSLLGFSLVGLRGLVHGAGGGGGLGAGFGADIGLGLSSIGSQVGGGLVCS